MGLVSLILKLISIQNLLIIRHLKNIFHKQLIWEDEMKFWGDLMK